MSRQSNNPQTKEKFKPKSQFKLSYEKNDKQKKGEKEEDEERKYLDHLFVNPNVSIGMEIGNVEVSTRRRRRFRSLQ